MDLKNNRHLYVYPTAVGYGNDDNSPKNHPLLEDSGYRWNGKPVTYNDLFRGVHDAFGHAKEGVGFRWDGEENAWRQHSAMYSPAARPAMTSETRGQNSWVNFGPYGQQNQTANQENTVYADQKAGLMPDWTTHEGAGTMVEPTRRVAADWDEVVRGMAGKGEFRPGGQAIVTYAGPYDMTKLHKLQRGEMVTLVAPAGQGQWIIRTEGGEELPYSQMRLYAMPSIEPTGELWPDTLPKTGGLEEFHEQAAKELEEAAAFARDIARVLPEEEWPAWVRNQIRHQAIGPEQPVQWPEWPTAGGQMFWGKIAADLPPNGGDLKFQPGDRVMLPHGGGMGTVTEVDPPQREEDGTFTNWVRVRKDDGQGVVAADWMLEFVQGLEGGMMPDTLPWGEAEQNYYRTAGAGTPLPEPMASQPWNDPRWLDYESQFHSPYGDDVDPRWMSMPLYVTKDGRWALGGAGQSHAYEEQDSWIAEDLGLQDLDWEEKGKLQGGMNIFDDRYELHWPQGVPYNEEIAQQIITKGLNQVDSYRKFYYSEHLEEGANRHPYGGGEITPMARRVATPYPDDVDQQQQNYYRVGYLAGKCIEWLDENKLMDAPLANVIKQIGTTMRATLDDQSYPIYERGYIEGTQDYQPVEEAEIEREVMELLKMVRLLQMEYNIHPGLSKLADFEGWTNWESWNLYQMWMSDHETHDAVMNLVQRGGTEQELKDWLTQKIIAPYNREQIASAKEWNSMPPEERLDWNYEQLKDQSPGAADIVNQMGFGPDVSDSMPDLIDPEMVNWNEVYQNIELQIEENRRYEQGLPATWQEQQPEPDQPGDLYMPDDWHTS